MQTTMMYLTVKGAIVEKGSKKEGTMILVHAYITSLAPGLELDRGWSPARRLEYQNRFGKVAASGTAAVLARKSDSARIVK